MGHHPWWPWQNKALFGVAIVTPPNLFHEECSHSLLISRKCFSYGGHSFCFQFPLVFTQRQPFSTDFRSSYFLSALHKHVWLPSIPLLSFLVANVQNRVCTSECRSTIDILKAQAAAECGSTVFDLGGVPLDLSTVVEFYLYKFDLACLTSSSSWCLLEQDS